MNSALKIARLLPRALLFLFAVAAPVLALPSVRADQGSTIEAPANKNSGVGFVIMVGLQRSQG